MGIRTYNPTSPGRRNSSVSDFAELTDKNKKPEKSLTAPLRKTGGRTNHGFITCRHRGGGHKQIHNIEMVPGGGAKLCRSAGVSATLTAREGSWAQITLPSGEVRRIPAACRASIGMVGNPDHMNVRLGKAGRSRWLGRRPHVRGVAMNPVDHPMGGGEGRTSGGRHPCSPTGKLAKGGKTRRRRKPSNSAIIRRRKSVRYGQLKV